MPKIQYQAIRLSQSSLGIIEQANKIIEEYQAQGFDLTLRQLYYQFVARGFISNKDTEYKRLGGLVNDGRMAGLIDWNAIVDRTRFLRSLSFWETEEQIVAAAARQFRHDKWAHQSNYVEVWIEKDALVGVIEGVCNEMEVPYFSCRGYVSQSEMWGAAQRIRSKTRKGKNATIIHLGDHDPSGKDMSRDIQDRLGVFGAYVTLERIALNMDQIEQYNPPPNPAKITDSRSTAYIAEFGGESWELDALEPTVLAGLIRNTVTALLDEDAWEEARDREDNARVRIQAAAASLRS